MQIAAEDSPGGHSGHVVPAEGSSPTVLGHLFGRLVDAALPARCPGCGAEGEPICGACRPSLYRRSDAPIGTPIGLPSTTPLPLLQLEWAAPFEGLARRAIHALKYGGERRIVAPLADATAARWRFAGVGGELLVPVPVHAERRSERGFDQAALLAAALAPRLGLPLSPILVRSRATLAQYRLGRERRAANVAGAFKVSPALGHPQPLAGRWCILVDDVVTSGATLAACAEVLLAAGARGVSALTVARER